MKIKLNLKKIIALSAITGLTLCNHVDAQSISYNNSTVKTVADKVSETSTAVTEPLTIVEYFDNAKEEVKSYFENDNWQDIKKKGKEYIVTGIDFIFFDEPINGIYFDDLTEDGKEAVMSAINSTIDYIYNLNPELFDTLDEKYQTAKSFINEKYLDALDKIREYLGDENYEALKDIKSRLKESASSYADKIGSEINDLGLSLKKKYQNWKNN